MGLMELIILWLIFGLGGALFAADKGLLNGFGWFILAILLGPFGIMISVARLFEQHKMKDQMIKNEHQKKCSLCGEIIEIEKTKCCYCGLPSELDKPR